MSVAEVFGIYEKTLFRDERTAITYFTIRVPETVKERNSYGCIVCSAHIPSYTKGVPLYIKGEWRDSPKGRLLAVPMQDADVPDEEKLCIHEEVWNEAVAAEYLASGICKGVGYATGREIVRKFGPNVFEFMSQDDAAQKIHESIGKLTLEKAKALCESVKATVAQRELFDFLFHYGAFYTSAVKLLKSYGAAAKEELCKQPFEVGMKHGLTFQQCDLIAKDMHMHAASIERLKAAATACMRKFSIAGDVFTFQSKLCDAMQTLLRRPEDPQEVDPSILIGGITKNDNLEVEEDFLNKVYLKHLRIAESNVAAQIKRLQDTGKELGFDDGLIEYAEKLSGINYAPQQRESFQVLKKNGFSVITGGPGTGKTTTINGIIQAFQKMNPDGVVKLCAPTGRAAQRMTESTGLESVTIHRLLDYRPYGNNVIYKNAENPIDADFIVVDEVSMLDIELASILLTAVKSGSLVLFVGDADQLLSVGAGDVLHDLICSECVPVYKLTTVYRQAQESPIIVNANRINEGDIDLLETNDFQIIHRENAQLIPDHIIAAVKKYYDPLNPFDTQVLSPTHKGAAGVASLNKALQKLLNPPKPGERELRYGNRSYRKNDKIIMLTNNYEAGYFNGDLGTVVEIGEGEMVVDILGKRITINRDIMEDVNLAYAMTIHKSQGSEFQNVIIALPQKPKSMLRRNLLYTAVTRAKMRVWIVAEYGAFREAIEKCDTGKRNTDLIRKLKEMKGK